MLRLTTDLRHALRILRQDPVLTAAAVLSIALGVAANTTVFSIANKLLFQPLPVSQPASLYAVTGHDKGERPGDSISFPEFQDLRSESAAFRDLAAYFPIVPASLQTPSQQPRRLWGQIVTGNYFNVAGVTPFRGRTFLPSEDQVPDRDYVIVLSYLTWTKHLLSDPNIVGQTIRLNQRPFTVIGIAPPTFRGADPGLSADFWVPMSLARSVIPALHRSADNLFNDRGQSWLFTIARLQPGISPETAQTALHTLSARLAKDHPKHSTDTGFYIERAGQFTPLFRGPVVAFLSLLLTVMLLVLFIACANVANLLLARAAKRAREISTRLAIGASRSDLIRQLLAESFVLAACGTVAAVALTLLAQSALANLRLPFPLPIDFSTSFDIRVAAFALALTLITTLAFGLAPALRATRTDLITALRVHTADGSPTRRRFRTANLLVAGQFAVAMLLLISTVLVLRSLQNAHTIQLGFQPNNLLLVSVDPSLDGLSSQQIVTRLPQIQSHLAQLPGVQSVSFSDMIPLSLGGQSAGIESDTEHALPKPKSVSADFYVTGAGYLATIGIPILAGSADLRPSPAFTPVIINQALADKLYPNQNPIGRIFYRNDKPRRVEAVAGNSKSRTIGETPRPAFYELLTDGFKGEALLGFTFLLRTSAPIDTVAPLIRPHLSSAFPNTSVFDVRSMREHVDNARILPRMAAFTFGFAGLCALILSITGLYGVVHYSVSRRNREFGIRMALGARQTSILSMVLQQGLRLATAGVAIGLASAFLAARLIESILYGVSPHDALTFTLAPLVLLSVALLATLLPAWRASRLTPSAALREE